MKGQTCRVWLGIISISLTAGINEELACRGVLQTFLAGKLGNTLALWVTAAVFGFAHAHTWFYALLGTVVGAYFGWLLLVTGNLVVPMISHFVIDVLNFVVIHRSVTQMTRVQRQKLVKESTMTQPLFSFDCHSEEDADEDTDYKMQASAKLCAKKETTKRKRKSKQR